MSEIKNPDDVVGVCSECNSDQPDKYMYASPFAQQGSSVPCKFCGGVVVITYRESRDQTIDQSNRSRGIS